MPRLQITVSTTLPQGVATAAAIAADHDVVLHVVDSAEPAVAALVSRGELSVEGAAPASRPVPVTSHGEAALYRAELVVVVAEAVAQRSVAADAARWLPDDAVVILAPG